MKADRDTNRLPLRAGAMILLAVAIVFIGLGWHRAATSGDDAGTESAATTNSAEASATASGAPSSGAPSSAPPSSTATDVADVPQMCVLNAGTVTGLAGDVSTALKEAGFQVSTAENLSTGSISENTVFYGQGERAAAEKVAAAVPGGASVDERPAVFTRCPGELAVIVVTK